MTRSLGSGQIPGEVFQAFNLQPARLEIANRIYKVSSHRGVFALKQIEANREKLDFSHSVIQYLRGKGLSAPVPYELTTTGEPLFIYDNSGYILCPWIEGRQLDFSSRADLNRAVDMMAEFHCRGEGYGIACGNWQRNRLGTWLPLWESAIEELRLCQFFGPLLNDLLKQATEAIRLLTIRGTYQQEVERADRVGTVCHRDLVNHNFLLDSQGDLHIIDFEYCAIELPVADVGRFLRKALPLHHWNWEVMQQLVYSYRTIYPISPRGMQLLYAYLTFPHEWWRMARRLMSGVLSEVEFAKKVERLKEQDGGRQKLLQQLAAAL